jgi:phage terminase small subunit
MAKKAAKPVKPSRPDVKVFIREYLRDPNGPKAAIAAGYSAKTAASQASRLLKSVKVRREIDKADAERLAKVQAETGITLERTLREIARIAYFDPRKLFDKDGRPLAITDLDDDTAAAIAGLEVLEEYQGSGQDRELIGHVKKWKLSDKKGGLDMLMKHLGGYEVDNQQKQPVVILATQHDENL